MRIKLIAASNKQPDWVNAGFDEYAKRLRGGVKLELNQVPLARRASSGAVRKAIDDEGKRMLACVGAGDLVIALAETGAMWRTADLARRLEDWIGMGTPACLLIGGPDGLSGACYQRADLLWSLSPLTLPHGIARVLVAEALYRAWSVLQGHPYHRA